MKKFLALLMALTMALSLAACGGHDGGVPSSGEPGVTEPEGGEDSAGASGTVEDITDMDPSENGPENLPAGEETGDASGKPAGGAAGDAQAVKPGTSKPTGGSGQSKPSDTKPETPPSAEKPAKPAAPEETKKSLSDLMTSILNGVDTPNYSITELTAEMYPLYLFIDQPEGAEAVSADAMIGSIAHSVVLMRLPSGADVSGIAQQVKDNADPRKWICVEAEKTIVKTKGDLVLLVMSDTAAADAIAANFDGLSV